MSQVLIQQYLNDLSDLRKASGTRRESVVREAFKDLLKGYAKSHDLVFIPEYEIETPAKERRYVDGALLHALRVPFGYWEAKDEKDDLDAEIDLNLAVGNPHLVCAELPREDRRDEEAFHRWAASLGAIGRRCRERGADLWREVTVHLF